MFVNFLKSQFLLRNIVTLLKEWQYSAIKIDLHLFSIFRGSFFPVLPIADNYIKHFQYILGILFFLPSSNTLRQKVHRKAPGPVLVSIFAVQTQRLASFFFTHDASRWKSTINFVGFCSFFEYFFNVFCVFFDVPNFVNYEKKSGAFARSECGWYGSISATFRNIRILALFWCSGGPFFRLFSGRIFAMPRVARNGNPPGKKLIKVTPWNIKKARQAQPKSSNFKRPSFCILY